MVSARKYVQSVEFFRNVQKHIFNILHGVPDEIEESKVSTPSAIARSSSEKLPLENLSMDKHESVHSFSTELTHTTITKQVLKKLVHRAAKLEILIAD